MKVGATTCHLCRISGFSGNTQWKSNSNLTMHRSQHKYLAFSYPRQKLTGEGLKASNFHCIETLLIWTWSKILLLKGKYHILHVKNYFFSDFFFPLAIIFQFRTDKEESETAHKFVPTPCLSFTLSWFCSFLSFSFVKGVTNSMSSQGLVTSKKHSRKCIIY